MAPLTAVPRTEKEKRANTVLTFARELEDLLSSPTGLEISAGLVDKLETNIQSFPHNLGSAAAIKYGELDRTGTALWNLSTRLKRNDELNNQQTLTVLAMARLYALLMLDCAQSSGKSAFTNVARVMRVALKTARHCLDIKELDFALKALEKAAEYDEQLKHPTGRLTSDDAEANAKLSSEYFMLRTMLEWRRDRLEVAEHMYSNASLSGQVLDPNTAESLADLLYEMGRELLGKKQFELAVKWLDRSFTVLNSQELDKLSADASELRTSIIQCSVKALLSVGQPDAIEQAHNLVGLLENEVGGKLIVLLLKLELLSVSGEMFDSITYGTVLQRIIRTVVLTDANFKLIMHHIRKLNDKSPSLACNALDELLQSRVFEAEKDEWLETVLINRLWMATSQRDGADVISSVRKILEMVLSNIERPVSSSATFAAQMLIWKRIESNAAMGQHEAAEAWCRLAMHQVFDNAGDLNKAKIARKLLVCALARQDMGGAREIYGTLSETAKNDPKTRFLIYKIAIRAGEVELASECLEVVHRASPEDPSLLYACVLDAQQVGHKDLAVAALQLVLEKHQFSPPSTIHLPALLRCTIRLMKSRLDLRTTAPADPDADQIVDQLCKLFEAAAAHAQKIYSSASPAERLFDINELDWFSKNTYNLALKHAADWEARKVLRMLQSCVIFIGLYPKDIHQQVSDDLSLRLIFCHFLATVLLISLARIEDNIEVQLQDYLIIRKHVDSFDTRLQQELEKLEEGPADDLVKKLSILLAYDFEAAVRLKKWEDLPGVILKADICKSMKVFELMADCLLCCEAPTNVIIPNLKRIVNGAWGLENFDTLKLSRYMRCLFQYALPHGDSVAEGLLDQIYAVAQEALESEQPYPAEELEWVSTTAFNRAIDFYCAGEDTSCKTWASKAINIASCCPDDGGLQGFLEKKLLGLRWST